MIHRFELRQVAIPNSPGNRGHSRALTAIDAAVLHRIHMGDPDNDNAESIALAFDKLGQRMPYTFIVPSAQPSSDLVIVEQACPLWAKTGHALAWNDRSVGIGVVGDFRKTKPTVKQKAAILWLCLRLQDVCTPHLKLRRGTNTDFLVTVHGALTTGTRDPQKLIGGKEECPGPLFLPTWRQVRKIVSAAGKVRL